MELWMFTFIIPLIPPVCQCHCLCHRCHMPNSQIYYLNNQFPRVANFFRSHAFFFATATWTAKRMPTIKITAFSSNSHVTIGVSRAHHVFGFAFLSFIERARVCVCVCIRLLWYDFQVTGSTTAALNCLLEECGTKCLAMMMLKTIVLIIASIAIIL